MKILFYGDSITDAGRNKTNVTGYDRYGYGYVAQAVGRLLLSDPAGYDIINTGISGNRIVDLYARVKMDLWAHEPDVISILIGVNDVWHEISRKNGVELDRFINIYRLMLTETKERLPNTKIMLCEPFVLPGSATDERYDEFLEVKKYAAAVKALADEFGFYFLPLQDMLSSLADKYGAESVLFDGVHPAPMGASFIADEWIKLFRKVEKDC